MSSILGRRPSAATIISCIALFCALGGVSYGFAAGTIGSRELVNNSVRGKDVRQGTLKGGDMKDGGLSGADVAADSLGGSDVDESSLGKVPAAAQADSAANANTVGGVGVDALTIGRSVLGGTCEPGTSAIVCVEVTLTLPRPGRVLLITGGQWYSEDAIGASVRGLCQIRHNGESLTSPTEEGSLAHQTDHIHEQAIATTTNVTNVLDAGEHTFDVSCSDEEGDMTFTDTRISAVLLGSS